MLSCNALNTGPEEADTLAASLADSLAAVTDDFDAAAEDAEAEASERKAD